MTAVLHIGNWIGTSGRSVHQSNRAHLTGHFSPFGRQWRGTVRCGPLKGFSSNFEANGKANRDAREALYCTFDRHGWAAYFHDNDLPCCRTEYRHLTPIATCTVHCRVWTNIQYRALPSPFFLTTGNIRCRGLAKWKEESVGYPRGLSRYITAVPRFSEFVKIQLKPNT